MVMANDIDYRQLSSTGSAVCFVISQFLSTLRHLADLVERILRLVLEKGFEALCLLLRVVGVIIMFVVEKTTNTMCRVAGKEPDKETFNQDIKYLEW